jgi:Ferric reductase like transmembrane component
MSLLETITWNIARAGGFTAFILLTFSVAMGLALSSHWQTSRWPRIINNELHNFLSLLALIFASIHILAIWLDPFTSFSWSEIFIPFMSHYRPIWTAFGIISFYLGLAIGLSAWLRPVIGYKWWRRLHVLTLLLYVMIAVHGIASGSDARTWWGTAIYLISIFLIGTLLVMRLLQPINKVITRPADASEVVGGPGIGIVAVGSTVVSTQRRRAHPVLALVTILVVLGGTCWAVLGPLQAGWAATKSSQSVASTTSNSTGNITPVSPFAPGTSATPQTTTPQTTFPQSFTGNLTGQITQRQSHRSGTVTIHFDMNISNGPTGNVEVELQGESSGTGGAVSISNSVVALLSSTGQPIYEGAISQLDTTNQWSMTAQLTGADASILNVQMKLAVDSNSGTVTGTITAGGGSSSGGSSNGSNSGGSASNI